MKLAICLLAVVTCVHAQGAGHPSNACVKVKHQAISEADSMQVRIANNLQADQSSILPDNYYRFNIPDFQLMDLVTYQVLYDWADNWQISMTADEIFPKVVIQGIGYIISGPVCTCVPAGEGPGTCTEGGCCIVTLQAHATYTDERAVLTIKARTNQMGLLGNREFCVCNHEFELFPPPMTTSIEPPTPRGEVTCYAQPCAPHACCHPHPEYSFSTDPTYITYLWYECECDHGWEGDGEWKEESGEWRYRPRVCGAAGCSGCHDIDECALGTFNPPCGDNAHCVNTPGSYDCTCNTGFGGDGYQCNPLGTACGDPVVYCDDATEFCGRVQGVCKGKKDPGENCYLDAAGNLRHEMCKSDYCDQSVNGFGIPIPDKYECYDIIW